jgi:hypothetical protein
MRPRLLWLLAALPLLAGCPHDNDGHAGAQRPALCASSCAAPEIDPRGAMVALTLLIGACLIARGRK